MSVVPFGDFNMNPVKPEMNTFWNKENLTNLIGENPCFNGAGIVMLKVLITVNLKQSYYQSLILKAKATRFLMITC